MSDETKEAVRLLVECMDELRRHDTYPSHRTDPELKQRLQAFMVKYGLDDPVVGANLLCENPLKGEVV